MEINKINKNFYDNHMTKISKLLTNGWSPEYTVSQLDFRMIIIKPNGEKFSNLLITEKAVIKLTEKEIHETISSHLDEALLELNNK